MKMSLFLTHLQSLEARQAVSVCAFAVHVIVAVCTKIFAVVEVAVDVVVVLNRNKRDCGKS